MKPKTKQDVCLTCYVPVDWKLVDGEWRAFEAGSRVTHRCVTGD